MLYVAVPATQCQQSSLVQPSCLQGSAEGGWLRHLLGISAIRTGEFLRFLWIRTRRGSPPQQANMKACRLICCCVVAISLFQLTSTWKSDRRPKVFGDKIPRRVLETGHRRVQRKIVLYHNFFRTKVSPPAADMLSMTWHKGAARSAQRWADQCLMLTHDNVTGRWLDDYGSCGQNIFISTQQVPWHFAIKTWFLEKNLFTYGSSRNNLMQVGHYTQMVWASTHKVGCGFSKCEGGPRGKPYYSYICNYCPIGNFIERLGKPYKKGAPCSKCEDSCRLGKLCTNACHWADLWANCRELNATWHNWLCHNHTPEGRERHRFCRATCNCKDKII